MPVNPSIRNVPEALVGETPAEAVRMIRADRDARASR